MRGKQFNQETEIQAVYLYRGDEVTAAKVGELGVVSINMKEGNAFFTMINGQEIVIYKKDIKGIALKDKAGNLSTYVIGKKGYVKKIRNEEDYGKNR